MELIIPVSEEELYPYLEGLEGELGEDFSPDEVEEFLQELSSGDLGFVRNPRIAELIARRFPRIRARILRRTLPRIAPAVSRRILPVIQKKVVEKIAQGSSEYFYHGQKPANNTDLRFFAELKERYNFKKAGIVPDKNMILRGITAWFTPPTARDATELDTLEAMMDATLNLQVSRAGKTVSQQIPLHQLVGQVSTLATDGNAAAVFYAALNASRVDRTGFFPLNIPVEKESNVVVDVNFHRSFTNTKFYLYIGLVGQYAG